MFNILRGDPRQIPASEKKATFHNMPILCGDATDIAEIGLFEKQRKGVSGSVIEHKYKGTELQGKPYL